MIIAAFCELASLGFVLPFLSILLDPSSLREFKFIENFFLNFDEERIKIFITLIFCSLILISGLVRILVFKATTVFAFKCGTDLSTKMFKLTLFQPYENHIYRNSSEVISAISKKVSVASQIILQLMTALSSFILFLFISFGLFYLSPFTAITASIFLGISYIIISYITRSSLLKNSYIESSEQNKLIKILQEGLGGIKEIILKDLQNLYTDKYRESDKPMREAAGKNVFLGGSPRFIMEVLGIVLIASLALFFSFSEFGLMSFMPILGALAIAAQRVLPAIQTGYASWAGFIGSSVSLSDALELLEQKINETEKKAEKIEFKKSIVLKKISYKHIKQKKNTLEDVSFSIYPGQKIAIVGKTGSGKSTLIDIFMGLIKPHSGKILVDDLDLELEKYSDWRNTFSHVPQDIFLLDTSIGENITFSSKIDKDKLDKVVDICCLNGLVQSKEKGIMTQVGEKGIQISGGQKQRIGIARAIYKQSKILILDEATSSLDNITEQKIMNNILKSDPLKTIIMIAHRLASIENFDQIIFIENGKVVEKGTYSELMKNKKYFFNLSRKKIFN